jgi:mRNA interferase RelE/StbE
MADYAVVLARSARKELEALGPPTIGRVIARIELLAANPRPAGSRKLRGSRNLWRVRVGDYRIVYGVDDRSRVVDIIRVRHRREAYEV